jgi:hypothetical protein
VRSVVDVKRTDDRRRFRREAAVTVPEKLNDLPTPQVLVDTIAC